MAYIGQSIKNGTFTVLDTSGNTYNGSNTTFNLGTQVGSPAQLLVSHDGVIQKPGTDYTLATGGTQITFTTAPASGASIFIVEISGAVGGPMNRDINGDELILDVDGDTSITADTDDQIDFKTGGTDRVTIDSSGNVGIGETSPTEALHISSTSNDKPILILENNEPGTGDGRLYFKHLSASPADDDGLGQVRFIGKNDADEEIYYARFFGKSPDVSDGTEDGELRFLTYNAGTETNTLTLKSGKVGVGTTSPTTELYVDGAGSGTFSPYNDPLIVEGDSYTIGLHLKGVNSQAMIIYNRDGTNGWFTGLENSGNYKFASMSAMNGTAVGNAKDTGTPALMLKTDGDVLIGKTGVGLDTAGILLNPGAISHFTATSSDVLYINRKSNDGTLVGFYQDGAAEGYIGVSGSTVSYNGFTGTHWSRLADNSKPTILKGTILESLDEMCDWYQVEFDITDGEGNTTTQKENYALVDGESVGDTITYTYEGTDYQATIIQEDDIKHTKSKVSDTADAKNVYGVFMDWDNNDDTVNDMLVAQTGTFVVRLNSSVTTLNKGDLIQSNGDGTGKVQADDIIRASTVAKVLSTTKIETYSDGSYIVPCSLHC